MITTSVAIIPKRFHSSADQCAVLHPIWSIANQPIVILEWRSQPACFASIRYTYFVIKEGFSVVMSSDRRTTHWRGAGCWSDWYWLDVNQSWITPLLFFDSKPDDIFLLNNNRWWTELRLQPIWSVSWSSLLYAWCWWLHCPARQREEVA